MSNQHQPGNIVIDRFLSLVSLMGGLIFIGTCGFAMIEQWSIFDSFYMTIITLSTVGYSETHDLTTIGRFFTSILIVSSMILMVYWSAGITSIFVSGELSGMFRRTKELRMISMLEDHVVVCGDNVMTRTIVAGLVQKQLPVVVVCNAGENANVLRRLFPDILMVEGDPRSELSLMDANVLAAKYLVAAMDDDMDNLLIAITGNGLGSHIKVYACAQDNDLATRLLKVGVHEVICPLVLGGEQVTNLICQPAAA